MTLEEALDWADMNFTPEATGDLHNKWVMKTLADEVRSMQGADEACKEVETALEGLPYKGTYAQQIQQMRLDMVTLQALVGGSDDISQALIDERESIAAQEPVAWRCFDGEGRQVLLNTQFFENMTPLYAAPVATSQDAARLAWIDRQDFDDLSFTLFHDQPNDGMYGVSVSNGWHVGKTFRSAIDAAMKGEQK